MASLQRRMTAGCRSLSPTARLLELAYESGRNIDSLLFLGFRPRSSAPCWMNAHISTQVCCMGSFESSSRLTKKSRSTVELPCGVAVDVREASMNLLLPCLWCRGESEAAKIEDGTQPRTSPEPHAAPCRPQCRLRLNMERNGTEKAPMAMILPPIDEAVTRAREGQLHSSHCCCSLARSKHIV